jgi:hypothetical protein
MSEQNRNNGKKFLKEYLHAETGRGKLRYQTAYPKDYWINVAYSPMEPDLDTYIRVEQSFDLSMREEDFDRLLEILGRFDTHQRLTADDYYRELESRLIFERQLRKQHPALKLAYDKYKLLVDMVANGKEIED